MALDLHAVTMEIPEGANIVVGQSHFIKTVEDIYEVMATTVPGAAFGLAFNESSGPCLVRADGNDAALQQTAIRNAQAIAAGHVFVLLMRNAYPVNVLKRLQDVPEVCSIFCATANPVQIVVAESEAGRGVMGVIDGAVPQGVEGPADVAARKEFLRQIGYKR